MEKKQHWFTGRVCLLITCVSLMAQSVQARTWDEIKQSGELRIGLTGDYSPLSFRNKLGHLVGFDVDMTKNLAQSLGLTVKFVETFWPSLSADLMADKFDIAAGGVTKTAQRQKLFALSNSVAKNGKIALSHCSKKLDFQTLEDIDQPRVKVVVNPGGTNEAYVNSHIKQAQIIRKKDNFDTLQAIRTNRADVMFTDLIEGKYYQNHEKGVFCIASEDVLAGTESYKVYMMDKSNPELLAKVNEWLAGNTKSRLAKQWEVVQ
ncbi:MAG TPA: amino acid ABC transporter substrate-binding protein [Vibrio sp.]|uniref:transporter substrate-binding domain-containing protein n=1 Tax=Vibrio sp. TaxID=678 RepID=UPI000EE53ECC|nr:transporter substrate-binding domain-containing protein [Vibrio sp.]HCH00270.1 amino acid ABC transporter substrate-binding protein [Vibrio sp.]